MAHGPQTSGEEYRHEGTAHRRRACWHYPNGRANRHNLSSTAYNDAAEIKLRATRKLGHILKDVPMNGGTRGQLTGDLPSGSVLVPPGNQPPTLAESGLTKKQSSTAYNDAAEIKLRAERRLGDILKKTPMNGGGWTEANLQYQNGIARPPTLAESGLTLKQSSRAQKLADISPEDFERRTKAAYF